MRKDGFYWIKFDSNWFIARWSQGAEEFELHGIAFGVTEGDCEEIDEREVVRESN